MVIVDTPIWSTALRRSGSAQPSVRNTLTTLIRSRGAILLGPIRQEILSGIKDKNQFEVMRSELQSFPDFSIVPEDYEEAAICFNRCRSQGIQGSNTDFLICAVSLRSKFEVFTNDRDFEKFASALDIHLFERP